MMYTANETTNGAKSGESRRTDVAPGPTLTHRGPPKRSGGTLSLARGTRRGAGSYATGTTPSASKLKILQWNAEGIQHKKIALTNILHTDKIDIACTQETHLTDKIRFTIRGYQSFRKDRKERHKGGIITLIKNNIAANEIETEDTLEIQGIKLKKNHTEITICIQLLLPTPIRHSH